MIFLPIFYSILKFAPTSVPLNVFRVVNSVDTLNKMLGLKLTEHDINYIYSFQDSKTFEFYFKI